FWPGIADGRSARPERFAIGKCDAAVVRSFLLEVLVEAIAGGADDSPVQQTHDVTPETGSAAITWQRAGSCRQCRLFFYSSPTRSIRAPSRPSFSSSRS